MVLLQDWGSVGPCDCGTPAYHRHLLLLPAPFLIFNPRLRSCPTVVLLQDWGPTGPCGPLVGRCHLLSPGVSTQFGRQLPRHPLPIFTWILECHSWNVSKVCIFFSTVWSRRIWQDSENQAWQLIQCWPQSASAGPGFRLRGNREQLCCSLVDCPFTQPVKINK